MWKVTKVVEIKIDRQNMIAGVLPRINFIDRPSYQSSTKKYDMVVDHDCAFFEAQSVMKTAIDCYHCILL